MTYLSRLEVDCVDSQEGPHHAHLSMERGQTADPQPEGPLGDGRHVEGRLYGWGRLGG